MRLNGKTVNLRQLEGEMGAAGLAIRSLGTAGDDCFTYTATGSPIDLPPQARAVIDAHTPRGTSTPVVPLETLVADIDAASDLASVKAAVRKWAVAQRQAGAMLSGATR